MYLCARVIDFTPLYDFNIGFWNCFRTVSTVWHFLFFILSKFWVMTSSVSECDTKNTDLSKLGSYRMSDTAQYVQDVTSLRYKPVYGSSYKKASYRSENKVLAMKN
jgi:hypothetical protein